MDLSPPPPPPPPFLPVRPRWVGCGAGRKICLHLWRLTVCVPNVFLMCVHLWRVLSISTSPTSALSIFPELLQLGQHRLISLPSGGTPEICFFGAGARPPHSLHWLLWRWCWQMPAPPHSLHVPSGAGAGRCPPPCTPCIGSFGAGAGRSSPPRTPCIGSFGAGAGRHCAASSSQRPPPRRPLHATAACRYRRQLAQTARRRSLMS
jgi:hypothetical protein